MSVGYQESKCLARSRPQGEYKQPLKQNNHYNNPASKHIPSIDCRPVIKDDEDMLKLFEKMPDYLICEDKLDQTAKVLQVGLTALTYIEFVPVPLLRMNAKKLYL